MSLVNQKEFPCQRSRLPPVHHCGHLRLVPLVLHPAGRVSHSYFLLEGEEGEVQYCAKEILLPVHPGKERLSECRAYSNKHSSGSVISML